MVVQLSRCNKTEAVGIDGRRNNGRDRRELDERRQGASNIGVVGDDLDKTFDIVATQFPTMPEVIGMVGPGLGEAERERKVFEEMALYLEHGRPVVALLEQLMGELKLEDLRLV